VTNVVAGPLPNSITGNGWGAGTLQPNSPYITPVVSLRDAALPPWRGVGYIAGTIPDGLVTFNGAGAVRTLDLFDRLTRALIATTVSAANGTYQFTGLTFDRLFDVVARGSSNTENDIIAARITAAIAPLKVTGSFLASRQINQPYTSTITINGGIAPYTNVRVASGALPTGFTLAIVGSQIVLSGTTPATTGNYNFTVAVDSHDGQSATSTAQAIAITIEAYRYWRVNVTQNNGGTNYVAIAELEFRAVVGGPDLTTPAGANGSAASSGDANSGNAYYMAFDDNLTNEWTSNALATPQGWIRYDFGSPVYISEISMCCNHATGEVHPQYAPMNFTVEGSNDLATWTTKKSVTGQTNWLNSEFRQFSW
jgi:hypothetical protein